MNKMTRLLSISLFTAVSVMALAQNPIVQTKYTADPAPMVYNDRLYLYTTHDEDNSTWFTMNDWLLYSTDDMVNWTDHGAVLHYSAFSWAKGDAWAAQCIERDGRFYLYVPVISNINNKGAIGVAVSDSPFGPFYDPLGKPLVQSEWGDIDPTVFIDDDCQAYLYWGNPKLKYVLLNDDMISWKGDIVEVPLTAESFGKRDGEPVADRPAKYEEGPWLYKRGKTYYMFWPGGPLPEFLGYSTAQSPVGPWKYGDVFMPAEGGAFTNHPGVVDFRGKTYLFYHNGALPGGGGFNRSVCVQELVFNADGSVPKMKMTSGITKGIATLNPYRKTEAETIAFSEGFKSSQNAQVGVFVTAMKNDSYICVRDVDFGQNGATSFTARLGTTHNAPVQLEIRIDSRDGVVAGSIRAPRTGGNDRWALQTVKIQKITGKHDLFFVVKGSPTANLLFFDYWKFNE